MASPIIIVGAGIAGLALALELASRNIPIRLYERAEVLVDVGAGLQLPPNGWRLLARHADLAAALDAVTTEPAALSFKSGTSGEPIASMPFGAKARERWAAPYRLVHRSDLQAALLAAVKRRGVEVILDAEFASVRPQGDRLEVTFRFNGVDESVDAAALIGADGVHSQVRAFALGDRSRATGDIAWRALLAWDSAPAAFQGKDSQLWLGPGAHLVTYPVSGGAAVNAVAVTPEAAAADAGLTRHFRRWHPVVREAIAAGSWKAWPLFERDAAAPWAAGRVALVGDAAHAMVPHLAQGAAQAVEDAEALARCLESHADPAEAFIAYEAERRPRVVRIQAEARANGRIYRMPWPASAARNQVLRMLGPERLMARVDWLYAADARLD